MSVDVDGKTAYRLALQTREQHIRRDKATSNICTAQALLANVAAMYAAYHGPEGLRAIANRVHAHATTIAGSLRAAGHTIVHDSFFDTVLVRVPAGAGAIVESADRDDINLRLVDADHVAIACDECTTDDIVRRVVAVFGAQPTTVAVPELPSALARTSNYLQHPVFHDHRSETAMLRFLRALSDKDLALDRTMIPLGSCTMKLNSAVEMEPISWPGFASIHPYAPVAQTAGYLSSSPTWSGGSARSPATTGYRCSPTPDPRASWPGCSRSTAITNPAATSDATSASSPSPRMERTPHPRISRA